MASRRIARTSRLLMSVALTALTAGCAVTAEPSPLPSTSSTATLTAGPSVLAASPDPTEPVVDPGDCCQFELPSPLCPSPPGPVVFPDVRVSIGDGPGVIAVRGATTFTTCTMTSTTDISGEGLLGPWLTATHQDRIRLQVQTGWMIVRVQGYDHPAVGDGGNIDQAIDVPPGSDRVDVRVPFRDGDAEADWTLWLVRVDGRVVGQVDVGVRLHLPAAGG
jgi:hypothetical protein